MRGIALKEGQDTIDSVPVQRRADGTIAISWSVLVPGETRARRRTTRAKAGTTQSVLRERAHDQARRILEGAGQVEWTKRSSMSDYLAGPVAKSVRETPGLAPKTRAKYLRYVALLEEEEAGRRSIGAFCKGSSLKKALARIATKSGTATARGCRKFLEAHVLSPLVTDEDVLDHDPIARVKIKLPQVKKTQKPEGGVALTEDERRRVIEWLVKADTDEEVAAKASCGGRVTREQGERKRRALVEMTLVQATCGLRVGEALALVKEDVYEKDGDLVINVTGDVSKTDKGREVPVVEPVGGAEAARVLRRRVMALGAGQPVFGAPIDPTKHWEERNALKGLGQKEQPEDTPSKRRRKIGLYVEIANDTGIELLRKYRSHVWRTTLATAWKARGVPEAIVSAYLGHSEEVDKNSYTGKFEPGVVANAIRGKQGKVLPLRQSA